MRKVNVLQHQYAITASNSELTKLSTKGIWICTGWYGWDRENKVAFLCHFDSPLSAASIPKVLKNIRSCVPDKHHFESVLVGGKGWFWSQRTRNSIKDIVSNQNEVNISITEEPFSKFPFSVINVTICSVTGEVSYEKLSGRPTPNSPWFWFFKPMQHVEYL